MLDHPLQAERIGSAAGATAEADLSQLFPPGRTPRQLTLIPAGCETPRTYASRFDLAMALAVALDGRELVLSRSFATYPGFDTFPAFSVHALGPAGANGVRAAVWLCCVAVQDLTAEELDRAVTEAQARVRIRGAA